MCSSICGVTYTASKDHPTVHSLHSSNRIYNNETERGLAGWRHIFCFSCLASCKNTNTEHLKDTNWQLPANLTSLGRIAARDWKTLSAQGLTFCFEGFWSLWTRLLLGGKYNGACDCKQCIVAVKIRIILRRKKVAKTPRKVHHQRLPSPAMMAQEQLASLLSHNACKSPWLQPM